MTRASSNPAGQRPSGTVLRRYVLFQIPGWVLALVAATVLHQGVGLPTWGAVALVLLWVVKDIAVYPLLRASYEVDTRLPVERLVGQRGIATEELAPRGYMRLQGELWCAEVADLDGAIGAGATVEVVGASGLTLVVREAPTSPGP